MYRVKLGNNVLYDLRDKDLILESPQLDLEINKLGSFNFGIYQDHPYFDNINKLSSVISVLKDNTTIFKGRVISDEQGLYNNKKIECEGVLGYLNDSIVRPYTFNGTPKEHFEKLFYNHNKQVTGDMYEKDKLQPGIDSGGNSTSSHYELTIGDDSISAKLLATDNNDFVAQIMLNVEENTTYTIFGNPDNSQMNRVYIYSDNLWGTQITAKNLTTTGQTFNTGSNTSIVIGFYSTSNVTVGEVRTITGIRIVKGTLNETQVLKVGNVTVTDPNDYIVRSSVNYASTWDILNDDLINKLGGYLRVRYENDGTYVDYLADFDDTSTQKIELGENLIDVLVKNNAADVYTAVIPLGAEIENESGEAERLTIKSVNNDSDFIVNATAYNQYGLIFAPIEKTTWEDVTVATNLLTKGINYLNNEAVMLKSSLEVKAIDLNVTDEDIERFFIYEYVQFISSVHNINQTYLLNKISIPLALPESMQITLGKETSSLTGIQMGNKQDIDNVINRVDNVEKNYEINKSETDNNFNEIREEIQTTATTIQQNNEEIIMTALEDYTSKSEFDTYREQVSTEFVQTADDFNFNFNNITSQINTINGNTQQQFQEINKYIRFVDGNIILGESGNEITLKIENDRIAFIQNNNEVAYFSNNKLTVKDSEFLNSLTIGNFAFKPRANGNLSLLYVGGEQV